MKAPYVLTAALAAALSFTAPAFAQTATGDATKQPTQSYSHSDVPKQAPQTMTPPNATKQAAQSYSHSDPGADSGLSKQH